MQIGPLAHPIKLQTAAFNTIAACGKVEVCFRLGGTPMRHNFLVFPKLPYRIVLGTEFIYEKKLHLDFENGVVQTFNPEARTYLCSHMLRDIKGEAWLLKTIQTMVLLPFQAKWVNTECQNRNTLPLGIVSPIHSPAIQMIVGKGLVERTQDHHIPVLLFNMASVETTLPGNTPVAWWMPVTSNTINESKNLSDVAQEIREKLCEETKEHLAREILLHKEVGQACGKVF